MFHAINARLARLAQRTVPRSAREPEPATASHTWAQAVIADRIRALGPVSMGPGKSATMYRNFTEVVRQHGPIIIVYGKQPGWWS